MPTHICIVVDAQTRAISLYVDRELDKRKQLNTSLSDRFLPGRGPLYLGQDVWHGAASCSFGDMRISSGAMHEATIGDVATKAKAALSVPASKQELLSDAIVSQPLPADGEPKEEATPVAGSNSVTLHPVSPYAPTKQASKSSSKKTSDDPGTTERTTLTMEALAIHNEEKSSDVSPIFVFGGCDGSDHTRTTLPVPTNSDIDTASEAPTRAKSKFTVLGSSHLNQRRAERKIR